MSVALLQEQFETLLGGHLGWQEKPAPETVSSGVPEIDRATGGLPRGCLTEIFGAASSGRASLLVSILAGAGGRQEFCALVDAEDGFDPVSAAAAGVDLSRLLWIRCGHNAEHALRAADLLLEGGGFGVVALDLGDTPAQAARRISLTSWFRLRRAVEHTPTVLIAIERQSNAKTCATLMLELSRERARWSGGALDSARLLGGMRVTVARRKPGRAVTAVFETGGEHNGAATIGSGGEARGAKAAPWDSDVSPRLAKAAPWDGRRGTDTTVHAAQKPRLGTVVSVPV
jgi:recombination protein RecA